MHSEFDNYRVTPTLICTRKVDAVAEALMDQVHEADHSIHNSELLCDHRPRDREFATSGRS